MDFTFIPGLDDFFPNAGQRTPVSMESHRKGDLTEAEVITELKRREIAVSIPFGDNERYDLLFETPDEQILRAQVKTGWTTDGIVNFRGYSQHTNSKGNVYKKYDADVDCFLVYSHEYERLFLVWEDEFDSNMSIRVEEPVQNHDTINWAEEYDFDERWPPEPEEFRRRFTARSPSVPAVASVLDQRAIPYVYEAEQPYDFTAVDEGGTRHRIRARSGTVVEGRMRFVADVASSNVDAYAIYLAQTDAVYLVPDAGFDRSISLRVEDPDQPDASINWAADYAFDEQWPP